MENDPTGFYHLYNTVLFLVDRAVIAINYLRYSLQVRAVGFMIFPIVGFIALAISVKKFTAPRWREMKTNNSFGYALVFICLVQLSFFSVMAYYFVKYTLNPIMWNAARYPEAALAARLFGIL